jgi:hypothetical protein
MSVAATGPMNGMAFASSAITSRRGFAWTPASAAEAWAAGSWISLAMNTSARANVPRH